MQITFINVGYGDAILFQCPDGYTVLLDGGSALETEFADDPYRIRCADFLRQQNIQHLNAVIISHIHEDHVCGLEPVLQHIPADHIFVPYPVEPFLEGRELHPSPDAFRSVPLYTNALNAYRRILLRANEQGVPITVIGPGDSLPLNPNLLIQVLAPKSASIQAYMELVRRAYGAENGGTVVTEYLTKLDATSNQTSLLLRIEMGKTVLLSAADSCPGEWSEVPIFLLENENVLKLPHHGQIDSISEQFMKNMPLEYVITTSASDRRYNSANPQVYQQLSRWHEARPPKFLFSDERSYPPYFSQPEGFQAIVLEIDSGGITPKFIKNI